MHRNPVARLGGTFTRQPPLMGLSINNVPEGSSYLVVPLTERFLGMEARELYVCNICLMKMFILSVHSGKILR